MILIGIVVDAVSEVMHIRAEDIEKAPRFSAELDMRYILGIAKSEDRVKILLDSDWVLDPEHMVTLKNAV